MKPFQSIANIYNKSTIWGKLFFILLLFLIVVSLFKYSSNSNSSRANKRIEGFVQSDQFLFKTGPDVYDNFYVDIYDYLVYNNIKDQFEIGEIINATKPTETSIILDIGSGTGHHVNLLKEKGINNVIGIDNSEEMVKKAKENYPNYDFIQGDIMNANNFQPYSFTHILCLYFTIYYMKDKQQFFKRCFDLLMGGGYLVIHLVDRHQFDPVLPAANPLLLLTPQRYAETRITKSNITFDDFKYESNFDLDPQNNMAVFVEKFKNKENGKVFRKNEHPFYMEDVDDIVVMAQNVGFIIQGKIDMVKVGYEYNYLYLFQKPN
jgi:SAM-dependent methyltransferase